MTDAPINPGRPPRFARCPECGEAFLARGLATHRRMRHGIAPDAAIELAGTLSRIASVLERIDERLATAPAAESPAAPERAGEVPGALPTGTPAPPPPRFLQEGLREVLDEIARVKRETEGQIAHLGGRPVTDEQKRLEQTAFLALAQLRRRQADLIYRLQTETGTNGNGIDALASI